MVETYRGGLELLCDSKKIHNVNVEFEQQNGEDKVVHCFKVIGLWFFFHTQFYDWHSYKIFFMFSVNHERIAFLGANQLD
jgi:hypothetical protein